MTCGSKERLGGTNVNGQRPRTKQAAIRISLSCPHAPSMSSSADTEVAFGKPKKRAGRPRQREAGSAGGAWKEEESGENVAADTLSPADAPTPLPASSFPAKVKSTNQTVLNFDTTGVRISNEPSQ